jgi:hypothetical protein
MAASDDLFESVLVIGVVGVIFYALYQQGGALLCQLPGASTFFPASCPPATATGGNPFPPGYVYPAETVTQAGCIQPGPIGSSSTIEGGTSLVTQSGQCKYPDGFITTCPPGSICPIDVPNHGGQSLPI